MQNAAVTEEKHEEIRNHEDGVGGGSSIGKSDDIVDNPERAGHDGAGGSHSLVTGKHEAVDNAADGRQQRNHTLLLNREEHQQAVKRQSHEEHQGILVEFVI